MSSVLRAVSPLRIRLLLVAALVALFLVVPHVRGDQPRMVEVDIALNEGTFNQIPAPGNPVMSDSGGPYFGDFFSGQAAIMNGTSRVGSFYFMGVGTALPGDDNFQNGANNLFAVARMELWGQGSIDVQGTVTFFGTSYLSITGGTGMYATATGQCSEVSGGESQPDHFSCEIH